MYKATIGIEVHSQIKTRSKMFCGCKVEFLSAPNTNICSICMGEPGVLPYTNEKAILLAIRAALALNAQINKKSVFARKNYYYPDLTKGYQITQSVPLAENGYVVINTENGEKKITIHRIHIEEDTGKLFHTNDKVSMIDFNRSGVPLLEIVTDPVIENEKEAISYLKRLRQIIRYIDISGADMEKGQFRCEPNISVSKDNRRGIKTEVKNLNSLKAVEKAIKYEIERQITILEKGGKIIQQTMLWDEKEQVTKTMRSKEGIAEYRYFKEPDLIPLIITNEMINEQKELIPELPQSKFNRLVKEYNIGINEAEILIDNPRLSNYFEKSIEKGCGIKESLGWITTDIMGILNKSEKKFSYLKITPQHLADLYKYIENKIINMNIAKNILHEIAFTGEPVDKYIKSKNLIQITDTKSIEKIIDEILEENPTEVKRYLKGNNKLFGFFVGQAMKKMGGKANPTIVNKLLKDILNRR
ncbi:Asp-tRNA(Asn)/Glu-tRNA(Gln) amidotransferase subunit GatB [candidate division WOR-3 bacterium]|nr:Asp-tRNA(Asn)/Glu-tRNA(Gln) amidotransferase subunit GatB [candidate division WOR-3 bacterium]